MSTDKKTHWKQLVNPDYIGAYALPNGEDLTVTIKSVAREVVTMAGGKKEECTVVQLVNNKPFIINATNSKSIHRLYGPYIEEWAGKQITLFASTTKFGGELVECLRIRPEVAKPKKNTITDERLKKAISAIQDGSYTVDKLHDQFILNDAQQAMLEEKLEVVNVEN
jgi:hypothetical protein